MRLIDRPTRQEGPAFGDFVGDWHLARRIDHAQDPSASFTGRAVLSDAKGGFWYREDGQLQIKGHAAFTAERRYFWIEDAGGVTVLFDDGRPFHQIDLSGPVSEDRHHCDPDIYDVHYDFTGWPNWTCTWRVQGPRKDYVMISSYSRAAL